MSQIGSQKEEYSSSEDLPYKFNGKQFDEETGLYYYGARYMNPYGKYLVWGRSIEREISWYYIL